MFKSTTTATLSAALLLAGAFFCGHAAATTVSLSPSSSQVGLGNSFSVDVLISDLGAADMLAVFDLKLNFDASKLSFGGYSLGSQLGDLGAFEALDLSLGHLGNGRLHLGELSFLAELPEQAKAFKLATLSFTATALGPSTLGFEQVTLGDQWGNALSANLASASVSAVPEPSSHALLLAGLGCLGLLQARRSRSL